MQILITLLHTLDLAEAVLSLYLALVWLLLAAYETLTTTSTTPLEFRIVVTPPEDGDRNPERGERKGKIIKMEKGRLAPPEKTSKAKKDWDRHRRESRKQKALAQR
ncbi:hypothetical protein HBI80_054290 [Parastagonospora nodorum]|nr:hypothetical protein HBI80_054290 [Parastagonospora nodorum]KAH5290029.1 hypothetical protein HBI11_217830 [Parastagonospora nodorum]KAH5662283.1 hypothetical protein HBI23_106050 [Parastagonospora nodorum]KAH6075315.1 hypothetical protein HBI67_052110 [Parastagonospora nodorum]KAH6089339.1 hypothetical protein HBI66_027610 [Parastagonospora nodorum]